MFVNRNQAIQIQHAYKNPSAASLFNRRNFSSQSTINMLLTTQIAFLKMLLTLCYSNVHWIFGNILKTVSFWVGRKREQVALRTAVIGVAKNGKNDAQRTPKENATIPTSVNYHFTRKCNYKCGFCFHTAKTSFVLPIEDAKRGLQLLKDAGMEKINFSGGEPFLHERGDFLGEMVRFCKVELQLPSVSIVSNGSMIKERWFKKYGEHLDILAISCDSFNEDTNQAIGRAQGQKSHLDNLFKIRSWCQDYKVAFKLNSVINTYNNDEDMAENISQLNPVRWKVFQCLLIAGENVGEDSLREAERFVISDQQFQDFLDRHRSITCLVPESNEKMRDSYLILDEYMRFLDCREGRKDPSKSILDVGVEEAIQFSGFDETMFLKRGGKYVWSKADMKLEW
ncbi:S-adenosylmethionine-dependent nucleotide dehydratase RSAD2 [Engraulis encrasicolus]|uniref:S-adenosylmethionine-dependent nucleotide dehydratase RSAD2 n=1 Tax=Engraulis encrasicolus TaxID=184585 RepID=UPI002FD4A8B0